MTQMPDIELTERESQVLGQISFEWCTHEELRASIMPMVTLAELLLKRRAIPEVRLLYFTDPERNLGGRGKSCEQIFESNGTVGEEILAHPNFLPYLRYFVFGPNLPLETIRTFKEAAAISGYLSAHDIQELTAAAKATVRSRRLEPHSAAEEFHKLALECGAMPSSAATLRQSVRTVRLGSSR